MKQACFSVILLCYKHFEYLYSAIDSVLSQDYPNIELVISDDGSKDFPEEQLRVYVEAHKDSNLTNLVIRQEPHNVGTVRHLNHAVAACSGAYIAALAGDDNFNDSHVLSAYVAGFSRAPETCYIEMAQTAMYNETMDTLEDFYLKPPVQVALEKTETDTTELLKLLIQFGPCLPSTSTCFKREFFEKFGDFDETYTLVEDYPMHIRLAEEGWIIHYESFVAIKHRHGGISHGQSGASAASSILYFTDLQRMTVDLVLSHLDVLDADNRKKVARQKAKELQWIAFHLARVQKNYSKMFFLAASHPIHSSFVLLTHLDGWGWKWHVNMLYICLGLWFATPWIAQMFELVTPYSAELAASVLCVLGGCTFFLWVCAFLVWGVNRIFRAVLRFPSETLAIG